MSGYYLYALLICFHIIKLYHIISYWYPKLFNYNNNYNNILKYNKDIDLYSIQSPYIKNINIIKRGYHTSLNNKLIIVQKDNKKNNKNNLEIDNFYK